MIKLDFYVSLKTILTFQANPQDKKFLQYCIECEGYKPPRAHHCRKCQRYEYDSEISDSFCSNVWLIYLIKIAKL